MNEEHDPIEKRINNRLERIESKVENLGQTMILIARLEERITTYLTGTSRLGQEIEEIREKMESNFERIRDRVRTIEAQVSSSSTKMAMWERLVWAIIVAIISSWNLIKAN